MASAGHDDTPKSKPITKPIAKPSLLGFLGPPNIHLNAAPTKVTSKAKTHELRGSFFCAVILQLGLLVIAAVTVYHKHTRNSIGHDAKPWGFPCYVGGSVLLFLSMFICSVVVEVSTKELKWTRVNKPSDTEKEDQGQKKADSDQQKSDHSSAVLLNHDDRTHQAQGNKQSGLIDPRKPRVLWIQPQQRINDQAFDPLIYPGGARNHIITSSRQDVWEVYEPHIEKYKLKPITAQETPDGHEQVAAGDHETEPQTREDDAIWVRYAWELLAVFGVLAGAIGFTIQFIGLRALPWPCSVSQLGATLLMAGVRAFLRRRLGRLPPYLNALPGYELDFLAHQIVMRDAFRNMHYPYDKLEEFEQKEAYDVCQWEVKTPKPRDEDSGSRKSTISTMSKDRCGPQDDQAVGTTLLQNGDRVYPTMELIYVRERLGNLCKWTSSASGPALALSQAIEFFLELFPPASSNLIPWQISGDAGQKGYSTGKAKVFIRRKETKAGAKDQATDSEWAVESGKLEAILSLWIATMESKMMRNVKENVEDGKNENDWRRRKMAIDQKVSCQRLLGPKNSGVLSRDIAWWAGTFLGIDENDNVSSTSGADHRRPLDIGFSGDSSENTDLRLPSTGSLPTLAAQHLLTCFMWTIVEYLPANCLDQGVVNNGFNVRVQIPNTLDSHSFSRTWERAQLAHEKLKKFTLHAEKLGLGTTTDILLCVIPAFSSHGMLPNEAILKQLPRIGHGEGAGWVEIAKCYKLLLETRIKKDPPERFSYAIVTRTMDFIELASEPLHSNTDVQELDELRPELKSIVKILSEQFRNVLSTLGPIYKLQNRQDLFKHIFESHEFDGEIFTTENENVEDFKKFIGFGEYHHKTCYGIEINWKNLLRSSDKMDRRAVETGDKQRNEEPQVASSGRIHVKAMAETDIFGRTPLHYAILMSRADIVKALMGAIRSEDRADYRGVDDCGRAPIHLAAASGNVEILQMIMEDLETGDTESQRTALGAQCLDGLTPLHLAVKGKHLKCVKKLLQGHFPRDAVDIWKRGPMHTAAINRSMDILSELLNKDMRPDLMDNFGKTPLTYLGQLELEDMPLGERMMKTWENFNTTDSAGNTIMHHAVKLLDSSRISGYITRGAVVHKADNKGKTPLHLAIEEDKREVVDLLLQNGAPALVKDSYGVTPFMRACGQAWNVIVDQIIETMKEDSNHIGDKDSEGRTALHYVCDFSGDKNKESEDRVRHVVKKLLPAILKGDEQNDFICPDQYRTTPLHLAALRGWESAVDELLANNIDINYQDGDGHKALYYAIENGHSPIFKTLFERKGKGANQDGNNPYGEALHMACEAGSETFVDLLIDNDMDPNWQSPRSGRTPFHEAIYQEQPIILRKLLEKNTIALRWDLVDHRDYTPLEMALYDANYDCTMAIMKNTNEEYTSEIGKCFKIMAGKFYNYDYLWNKISEETAGITTSNLEILISRLPRSDSLEDIFSVWKDRVSEPEHLAQMRHPAHLLARCKEADHEELKELVKLVKDKAWEQDEDNWTAVDVADKYDNPTLKNLLTAEGYEKPPGIEYRWPLSFETVQNLPDLRLRPIYEGLEGRRDTP